MYKYGKKSRSRLETCHPLLQLIFNEAIKVLDITILEGKRGEEKQNNFYHAGKSKLRYPQSKHNREPSEAVDAAPYPVDWNNLNRFYYMAGVIKGIAQKLGIPLRWGGDWDRDGDITDNKFQDLPHFELDIQQ